MALELEYDGSGVINVNTVLIPVTDVDALQSFVLQVASMGTSGVIRVQQSNDGVVWDDTMMSGLAGSTPTISQSAVGMAWGPIVGRYLKVILSTATTAGTTSVRMRLCEDRQPDTSGTTIVTVQSMPATPAGTNLIGASTCSMSATAAMGAQFSIHRMLVSAATTNATSVKTSAGRVALIKGSNSSATSRFLKLYNKATVPTVGTDTPILTIALRPVQEFNIEVADLGISFSAGIAYAITAAVYDNDTGAITAGDIIAMNIVYI